MGRRLSHSILIVLVTFIALGSASGVRAEDQDPIATARQHLQAGRLFPAERAARAALELEPDSAEAHLVLGTILIRRTRFEEAESELARAAEIDPDLPDVHRELGLVRFELEDFEGARVSLERAVDVAPDDSELWLRLGLCELELERPEQAAQAFETAALDPDLASTANYYLGVARKAMGNVDEARAAFEEALRGGLPTSVAERAQRHLAGFPEPTRTRPLTLSAAVGALYESAVAQPATDQIDRQPDGAAQIEFGGAYELPIDFVGASVGYDFYQKLYFETETFDLQSHTLNARIGKKLGPVSASLGYVYSLNLLGDSQDRFLDFHEVRATGGMTLTDWWYVSFSPGFRAKRFDRSEDDQRDANTAVVGLLQLFPLGDWSRYVILGLTYEYEDAKPSYDHNGLRAQLSFHLPVEVFSRELPIDIRYVFQLRDYTNDESLIGSGTRQDRGHFARFRLGIPIAGPFRLQTEYEFERVYSQLDSADRTVHQVGMLLQFEY
jgi:tetratricopeptide (TPR) repeat protein